MISSKHKTAAWFDIGTLIQHSGIDGFGKWDGLLILFRSLIKLPVYRAALTDFHLNLRFESWQAVARNHISSL